ncbi:MAG: GNAT family N-acetyltransferase [Beijerinckiaceae bacterium]
MSEPFIRPASMADAEPMAAIHAQGFDRPWGLIEFERLLAGETAIAHVATAGSRGGVEGFVLSRVAADEAEILSIAVASAARGCGVAGKLLGPHREALALARVRTLFLEVEEGNAPALKLYARQGFTEVSRRSAYYRKADGSLATALVMRRSLI